MELENYQKTVTKAEMSCDAWDFSFKAFTPTQQIPNEPATLEQIIMEI